MHPDQFIRQNAFKLNWQNNPQQPENLTDGFYAMRDWQIPAFELLKNAPHMILNAPMGSGKSWLMCLLSAFKMQENQSLHAIIAVPQTIIAPGFIEAKIIMPDSTKLHWLIKHDLCNGKKTKTVEYIIKWLHSRPTSFNDRTIICTHATLLALHTKLRDVNQLHLLNDLLIWIDEAHHVKNTATEGNAVDSNSLGKLVTHALTSSACNAELGLTTASFFRGDRCSLLTPDMEAKFKRFNLPFDEYFKSMKHLKSFSYDFLLCGPDYFKALELILKQRRGKDIVYIPHPTSQHSTGNKYKEVETIVDIYHSVHGHNEKGNKLKILDLVNETGRIEKKEFLNSGNLKENRDALDAIITLGMFKEGANWIWADRIIIVGARSSLLDMDQMIGRLFRDAEGKEHVEVIQLLPFALDQQDPEAFQENLNNYFKAILATLILENILNPVSIKARKTLQPSDDNALNTYPSEGNKNWLSLAIPDEAKQELIVRDVCHNLFGCTSREEREQVAQRVLENHGIIEHKKEVANQILNMFSRRSINMDGISSEDIHIDLIYKTDPLDFLLRYTSRACNLDTFQKLRDAIALSKISWRPFEEARDFTRSLNLKNQSDWFKYRKTDTFPENIPAYPNEAYANKGWISWGDWLGTGRIASRDYVYLPFEDARTRVRSLNLKNNKEWRIWAKTSKPQNIPSSPDKIYLNQGWISWGDFLGTGSIGSTEKIFQSFNAAKALAQKLGFKTRLEWESWPERPQDIPSNPSKAYANEGWTGWGDFLGTGTVAHFEKQFRSFHDARTFTHRLSLKGKEDWARWSKSNMRPADIPSEPSRTYAEKGWAGWKDWLGTNTHLD